MNITAIIEDKKSDAKRTAYKIQGKWMSTFDLNCAGYDKGNSVKVEYTEVKRDDKTYYNIQRMELNQLDSKIQEEPLTTDVQIKRQVYLKLATDIILKTGTYTTENLVKLAKSIETECKKQKYL